MKLVLFTIVFICGLALGSDSVVWSLRLSDGWGSEKLILFTGFGPFGSITDNPSGRIARPLKEEIEKHCPPEEAILESQVLKVEPGIIEEVEPDRFDTIVSLGVAAGSKSIRIETAARNRYDDPITGLVHPIDPELPLDFLRFGPRIPQMPSLLDGFRVTKGDNDSAGTYVCNDTFYRLCRDHGRGYFIHIPYVDESQDSRLARALGRITCKLFERS